MTRKKPAPRDLQQPRQYPSTINDAGRAGAMLSRNQLLSSQTEQVVVDLPAGGNGPPAQSESSQRKKSENIFKVLRSFGIFISVLIIVLSNVRLRNHHSGHVEGAESMPPVR